MKVLDIPNAVLPESDNFDKGYFLREFRKYCFIQAISRMKEMATMDPSGSMYQINKADLDNFLQHYA